MDIFTADSVEYMRLSNYLQTNMLQTQNVAISDLLVPQQSMLDSVRNKKSFLSYLQQVPQYVFGIEEQSLLSFDYLVGKWVREQCTQKATAVETQKAAD